MAVGDPRGPQGNGVGGTCPTTLQDNTLSLRVMTLLGTWSTRVVLHDYVCERACASLSLSLFFSLSTFSFFSLESMVETGQKHLGPGLGSAPLCPLWAPQEQTCCRQGGWGAGGSRVWEATDEEVPRQQQGYPDLPLAPANTPVGLRLHTPLTPVCPSFVPGMAPGSGAFSRPGLHPRPIAALRVHQASPPPGAQKPSTVFSRQAWPGGGSGTGKSAPLKPGLGTGTSPFCPLTGTTGRTPGKAEG